MLGNDQPIASLPGEIVVNRDFYSYDAKYLDDSRLAPGDSRQAAEGRSLKKSAQTALQAYQALCCEGMARVDFFVQANGRVLVNEINTIPGFTKISMYPKMWEASGIPYSSLIDRLIRLALERFRRETALKNFQIVPAAHGTRVRYMNMIQDRPQAFAPS